MILLKGGLITASETDDISGPMLLRGRAIQPMGRLTFANGAGRVQVAGEVSAGYDSNVNQSPDAAIGDGFWLASAGIRLGLRAPLGVLRVDSEVVWQDYFSEPNGERFSARLHANWTLEQRFQRLRLAVGAEIHEDPLLETGQSARRADYSASAQWRHVGRATGLEADLNLRRIDHLEDNDAFGRDERDRVRGDLRFGVNRSLGQKNHIGARARVFGVSYDIDGSRFQDAVGAGFTVFWRLNLSQRLGLTIEPGIAWRRHDHDFDYNPAFDDRQMVVPEFRATLRWQPATPTQIDLFAESLLVDGVVSNAAQLSRIGILAVHELNRRFYLRGNLGFTHRLDSGAAEGRPQGVRSWNLGATLGYVPQNGLRVEFNTTHTDQGGPFGFSRWVIGINLVGAF